MSITLPDTTHFNQPHLLGIEGLSIEACQEILALAEQFAQYNKQKNKKLDTLKGETIINLFFENSTRTRTSFEIAGKRLGADVINMSVASSSVKKGETIIDTATTLRAMSADHIVVRHGESGVPHMLARHVDCAVINAGDGCHAHPTQALLDALTIQRKKGQIKGLKIVICGDIAHSRVARSNITLLKKLGAQVIIAAPRIMLPVYPECLGADIANSLPEALNDADIVMMLRVQNERMQGAYIASIREYFHRYGLDYTKLKHAKKDALVMHPGPINRGVELDSALADDVERSIILEQVEMGIAVRQAVLVLLSRFHRT